MNRLVTLMTLSLTCAAAQAQLKPLAVPPAAASALQGAAPAGEDTTPLPLIGTRQMTRPIEQVPGARFDAELSAANARALSDLNQFRMANVRPLGDNVPVPANCDRRVLKVGFSGSTFTVRPGQTVAIGGCFGNAPAGEVRLNGSYPGGHVRLTVLEWTPTHVHARMPELTGVFDSDNVRLQLKFGDGDFSNEFAGHFRARRAVYAAEAGSVGLYSDFVPMNTVGACTWEAPCPFPVPQPLTGQTRQTVFIKTTGAKLGSYALKMRHPQHHIMGVYASTFAGQLQFSNWSANGELVLDWASGNTPPSQIYRSLVRFDKVVFDAPVGTAPSASLQMSTFQPVAGLPK